MQMKGPIFRLARGILLHLCDNVASQPLLGPSRNVPTQLTVGEEHCVTTLITAAKETTSSSAPSYINIQWISLVSRRSNRTRSS